MAKNFKQKSSERERVVFVLGGDHHNTLAVIRSLGIAGFSPIPIVVSESGKSFVVKSHYVREFRIVRKEEDLEACLRTLYKTLIPAGTKPKIICCSDGAAVVADASMWIREHFCVPGIASTEVGALSRMMGKAEMMRLAEASGFLVPKTFRIAKNGVTAPSVPGELSFPCIIKPEKSFLGSKFDFRICRSADDWFGAWASLPKGKEFLVQTFLQNARDGQLLGVRLSDGKCVLGGSVEKPICCPETHNLGMTIMADFLPDTALFATRESVETFLEKTGYVGPFSLEFLVSESVVYFVEINFRTDGNFYLSFAGGVNLPAIWCEDFSASKFSAKRVRGLVEISYLKYLALKNPFRLFRDFCRTDVFGIFSLRDPRPFFAKLFSKMPF